MALNDGVLTAGHYGTNKYLPPGNTLIGRGPTGNLYQSGPAVSSAPTQQPYRMSSPGYAVGSGAMQTAPSQAMQWTPQRVSTQTGTSTRTIGAMPDLPEYEDIDEAKVKSRTQEFSALGRREARSNFQDLLARIYGANPDDPYAKNLARKASQGFSMDTQRAISAGGREALSMGLQDQQIRNNRRMTAYSAAVNAVLGSATTTTSTEYQYAPTPMQSMPTNVSPTTSQQALSTQYNYSNPLSLGQPYTYG